MIIIVIDNLLFFMIEVFNVEFHFSQKTSQLLMCTKKKLKMDKKRFFVFYKDKYDAQTVN